MPHVYGAAVELLEQGVATLLEKPPGTTLDEFRHLCELAESKRAAAMIGLNRRHYSVVRKALEDCGGPDKVTAVFVEWSEDPRHLHERGFSDDEIARMVFGNSLHGLDLLTHLAGPVDEPDVLGRELGEPLRWMMALQGLSRRGALASFHSTWDSPGRWRVSFCSPGRRYVFAPLESCQVSEAGVKEPRAIEPDEVDMRFKPGFFAQAQVFLRAIAAGEAPPQYNLASAAPAMRLADALTRACRGAGAQ
jgi:predicted dehydrogenase